MCGILGVVDEFTSEAQLRAGLGAMWHRGPDSQGLFLDEQLKVGLGHTRLAVIDLAKGQQPLTADAGNLVLVCNGELYGFEEIRADLERRGHLFTTRSDAEIVLHLYRQHGIEFLRHLRGEFAFILLDKRARRLIAARDRFGIKPLFYSPRGRGLVLASEAKAMFATGLRECQLDPAALRDSFCLVMPRSYFEGVEAIPPGHYLDAALGGTWRLVRYWDFAAQSEPLALSREESAERVAEAVEDAVAVRLRADVPIGLYLSGGLDSAAIAAVAARRGRLTAFTLEFPGQPRFDEHAAARAVAVELGLELETARYDEEALCACLEDCVFHVEQPFMNMHVVGKFLLSRLARTRVKVVLTGEGADEVFLGYELFKARGQGMTGQLARSDFPGPLPGDPVAQQLCERFGFVPQPEMVELLSARSQQLTDRLFHPELRACLARESPLERAAIRLPDLRPRGLPLALQRQRYAIGATLANYILPALGDRVEMAHSIEGRQPFLDHHLFELAARIPLEHLLADGVEKSVLRRAMAGRMPESARTAPKRMFAAPPQDFLASPSKAARDLVEEHLSPAALEGGGIFDPARIAGLRELHAETASDSSLHHRLTSIFCQVLTTQMLQRRFSASVRPAQ